MPTTPNMNLSLPTPSQTPGPEWANNINTSLTLVDQHDHADGRGVPVTPAGMSITADLPFQNHGAIQLSHAQFVNNTSLELPTSIYVFAGDLYYNNSAGQSVAITNGDSVNAASGNITGLDRPAAVNYDSGTFSFLQDTDGPTSAVIAAGWLSLTGVTPGVGPAITIKPPLSFATYNLTLPPSAPATQAVMTMNASGVVTNAAVDGTLTLTPSLLKVGTIQTANIASSAVTSTKIQNGAVDRTKLAAVGQSVSVSSGIQNITSSTFAPVPGAVSGYVSCSLNVATTRPIIVFLQSASTNSAYISTPLLGSEVGVEVTHPGGGAVTLGRVELAGSSAGVQFAPSSVNVMVLPASWGGAGTFTFTLVARSQSSGQLTVVDNCQLVAYQL